MITLEEFHNLIMNKNNPVIFVFKSIEDREDYRKDPIKNEISLFFSVSSSYMLNKILSKDICNATVEYVYTDKNEIDVVISYEGDTYEQ